ncbi:MULTISPECIES: substrate-binding periplasmic protein [unclassified Rhizobium]|uniref:substrate-binding periplasmic protein n=1 Tax=unclassified Rhizobium TaxID=2613769 RepID=UPI001ADC17A2|nr:MULTISPECIES: transporter substrate-binding domain-containing protein [unclassified Rhizobium]MBO9123724.1 transporter substrate-binding domain-containing protein [Rhizobium sp. 16-488-2b]MBO9174256.1 transporter substrate-binding domain-containing protein [Rhizobium sp. 16-488-2a]
MLGLKVLSALTLAASIVVSGGIAKAADVPAAGASPRIDAIKKAGVLRVGVLANTPWLVENTTGSGEPWEGPAWLLAQEYATQLGVKLQPVPVSHETKVPVLASNQVDLSITPLAETPERLKVVDFVLYSKTSVCIFGRKDNKKFSEAASVDAVNAPDFTVAYFIGGAEENWVKERFPNAKLRGVTSSSAPAPIEEIMAKRADAAAINRVQWVLLNKKVPGLTALPKENNCQDSNEKAAPVGLAIDKGQDVFLEWLRAVEKDMQPKLTADEARTVETMK